MARNAAAYLASALERLAAQPADIQAIIRSHVEKHYPDTHRRANAINFDHAKANCIQTRINHETALKQKREAELKVASDAVAIPTSSPQSEISNLKSPIPPQPVPSTSPTALPTPFPSAFPNPLQPLSKTTPKPFQSPSNPMESDPQLSAHEKRLHQLKEIQATFQKLATAQSTQPATSANAPAADNSPFAHFDPFSPSTSSTVSSTVPAPDSPEEGARLQAEITARLHTETQSPLDTLPPEKQEILFELLSDFSSRKVAEVITQPAPTGWGIQTTHVSLLKFKNRYTTRTAADRRRQNQRLIRQILDGSPAALSDLDTQDTAADRVAEHLFKQHLLELANAPGHNHRDLRDMFQIYIRLRHAHVAEKRLALSEKRNKSEPAP
jgi:hypothetical protein